MDVQEWVEERYPEVYEEMCGQDMYHVSEYCEWFYRGLHMDKEAT
jgi:hypothetical protein